MDREEYDRALHELERNGNRIFYVVFRRRTDKKGPNGDIIASAGTFRNMTCRLHVRKGVKGVQPDRRQRDRDNNVVTVFEMAGEDSGFRCIPLDSIVHISGAEEMDVEAIVAKDPHHAASSGQ